MRVLIVEDNPRLVALLEDRKRREHWQVDAIPSVAEAIEAVRSQVHDLVLVDLGLPDGDGIDLIRQIRRDGLETPILIITARSSVEDRIRGLEIGADDYLVKPFNHEELVARCRAVMRRKSSTKLPEIVLGDLVYRRNESTLVIKDNVVPLTPRETAILELLIRHAATVVSKSRLEAALSSYESEISENALEQAVSRLRKKIESLSEYSKIATIRGLGYMLTSEKV